MLGNLCGFSRQDGEAQPEWGADGLRLLGSLAGQLGSWDARSAPLLQRLFLGAWQPFGEALEAWLFTAEEVLLKAGSPFAAELPSDLSDLLPERCRHEVWACSQLTFSLDAPECTQNRLPQCTSASSLVQEIGFLQGRVAL